MLKNKEWICKFIALFILISGMWVDEVVDIVKADSFFLCPKLEVSAERMEVLSDKDLTNTEILCTRSTISGGQIAAQILNNKRIIKLTMLFLCVAVFALLLSNFYTAERVAEIPILCTQTAVLNYIHNTDGKK